MKIKNTYQYFNNVKKKQKSNKGKIIIISIIIFILLSFGCSKKIEAGEQITLSEDIIVNGIPRYVIPYGGGPNITLSQLEFREDSLYGTVQYKIHEQSDYTLAVFIKTDNRLLVSYFDTSNNLTATGENNGQINVLFSASGYEVKESDTNKEILSFSIQSSVWGVYDLNDIEKTVYVFCIPGKVDPHYLPDYEDQTFPAVSNIISIILE